MSAEEYYGDNKHSGNSSIPPYSYPPGPPKLNMPPGNGTGYPSQNPYEYTPQDFYAGYQQQQQPPPPPYYQHPAPPAQSPYPYTYPPLQPTYPGANAGAEYEAPPANDRGALGAIAGGAAGAYAGHQVHHGVLGTIGGAITGSLAEDAIKHKTHDKVDEKKSNKWGFHHHRSSSSSSSDSDKEEAKPAPSNRGGNFSASSGDIALQGNYELVASCRAVSGRNNSSRLPLNSVLTNEFGHFKWRRGGNFGGSARNARLTEGGRVLEAELADGNGGWKMDWVRLDERISNQDGVLVFLD